MQVPSLGPGPPTGDTSINTVVNENSVKEPREPVREDGGDECWEVRRRRMSVDLNLAGSIRYIVTVLQVRCWKVCKVWMFVRCTCVRERENEREGR